MEGGTHQKIERHEGNDRGRPCGGREFYRRSKANWAYRPEWKFTAQPLPAHRKATTCFFFFIAFGHPAVVTRYPRRRPQRDASRPRRRDGASAQAQSRPYRGASLPSWATRATSAGGAARGGGPPRSAIGIT